MVLLQLPMHIVENINMVACCQWQVTFEELEKVALASPDPIHQLPSGSAEKFEVLLSSYL